MAKRQQRFTPQQLPQVMDSLQGQLSTLVLRSGRALQVRPLTHVDNTLVVSDMLGKKNAYPLSDILEIILEQPA